MAPPLVGEDRELTLPDGRTVVCWEGGDPAGKPGPVPLRHAVRTAPGDPGARGGDAVRRTPAGVQPAGLRPLVTAPAGAGTGRARRARRPGPVRRGPVCRARVLRWRPLRPGHGAGRPVEGHGDRGRGRHRPVDADRGPRPRRLGAPPAGARRARRRRRSGGRFRRQGGRGVRLALAGPRRRRGPGRFLRRRAGGGHRLARRHGSATLGGRHPRRAGDVRRLRARQPLVGHDLGPRPRAARGAVPSLVRRGGRDGATHPRRVAPRPPARRAARDPSPARGTAR